MQYISTYNKSGQATIPATIAKILGLTPGQNITFDLKKDQKTDKTTVTISRTPTRQEYRAEMERLRAEELKRDPEFAERIKKYRGKTANELRDIWTNSPEGQAYYKEKYGLK